MRCARLAWVVSRCSNPPPPSCRTTEDDYSGFLDRYGYQRNPEPWWFELDFGKPNATREESVGGHGRRCPDEPARGWRGACGSYGDGFDCMHGWEAVACCCWSGLCEGFG